MMRPHASHYYTSPHIAAEQVPIRRPILITGMYRTGTTLLQRLLARDPVARSVKLFELHGPLEYPTASKAEYNGNDPDRITAAQSITKGVISNIAVFVICDDIGR